MRHPLLPRCLRRRRIVYKQKKPPPRCCELGGDFYMLSFCAHNILQLSIHFTVIQDVRRRNVVFRVTLASGRLCEQSNNAPISNRLTDVLRRGQIVGDPCVPSQRNVLIVPLKHRKKLAVNNYIIVLNFLRIGYNIYAGVHDIHMQESMAFMIERSALHDMNHPLLGERQLCERIRQIRLSLNWSQELLAVRSGMQQARISRLETGRAKQPIAYEEILSLAQAFGVSAIDFIKRGSITAKPPRVVVPEVQIMKE